MNLCASQKPPDETTLHREYSPVLGIAQQTVRLSVAYLRKGDVHFNPKALHL
jgi:hypothetical protein